MKIERNAPCPCHSGLKYKKCCLLNPERNEAAVSINSQYIDSNYVLANLRERSPVMSRFLNAIPKQITDLLWIFINPRLNANMRSASAYGHLVIIIRQFPIADEDFFDFAHEVGHFIFVLNNYPSCGIISGDLRLASLATVLTNTIMDPLVNQLVVRYGFDFDAYVQKSFRIQLNGLKFPTPNNPKDRHMLRCLCIEKILEWRLLNIPFDNLFLPVFEQYHPNEYNFAVNFVNRIDLQQLGNPKYVKQILSQLIHENQMQDTLILQSFG